MRILIITPQVPLLPYRGDSAGKEVVTWDALAKEFDEYLGTKVAASRGIHTP
jgi:hypothetical protein